MECFSTFIYSSLYSYIFDHVLHKTINRGQHHTVLYIQGTSVVEKNYINKIQNDWETTVLFKSFCMCRWILGTREPLKAQRICKNYKPIIFFVPSLNISFHELTMPQGSLLYQVPSFYYPQFTKQSQSCCTYWPFCFLTLFSVQLELTKKWGKSIANKLNGQHCNKACWSSLTTTLVWWIIHMVALVSAHVPAQIWQASGTAQHTHTHTHTKWHISLGGHCLLGSVDGARIPAFIQKLWIHFCHF